ncbi:hypothetical protein GCM10009108_07860 [Castellaniella ginsengisoli]|uniref:Uncharacterized protein n=1 Tax=Castellaniella ginsengisoli TaxID=546114 RepID=A0ABP3W6J0_9BURK
MHGASAGGQLESHFEPAIEFERAAARSGGLGDVQPRLRTQRIEKSTKFEHIGSLYMTGVHDLLSNSRAQLIPLSDMVPRERPAPRVGAKP